MEDVRLADQFDAFYRLIKNHDLLGVQQLVEAGADVNVRNPGAWTPLMAAAWKGRTPIVKYLLSAGADIAATNAYGDSALACAALEGHCNVVEFLLASGAPLDVRPGGRSLLEYAAIGGGRFKTQRHFEMLRKAGAQ
jgi:ankyrin repeat protein